MSKFSSKKSKEIPAVNTASLPDIVFMLLFFFMVTTTMRDLEMLVGVLKPKATEIQKIDLQEKPKKKIIKNESIINSSKINKEPELIKMPLREEQSNKLQNLKTVKINNVETLKTNKIKPKLKLKMFNY